MMRILIVAVLTPIALWCQPTIINQNGQRTGIYDFPSTGSFCTPSMAGVVRLCGNGNQLMLSENGGALVHIGSGGGSIPSVTNIIKGNGSGGGADTKVGVVSPATSATIQFAADNETVTLVNGIMAALGGTNAFTGSNSFSSTVTMNSIQSSDASPVSLQGKFNGGTSFWWSVEAAQPSGSCIGGNLQAAFFWCSWQSGLSNPANYGNLQGFAHTAYFFNGTNTSTSKSGTFGEYNQYVMNNEGQHGGTVVGVTASGIGDQAMGTDVLTYGGYNNDTGGEGIFWKDIFIEQENSVFSTPIATSPTSSCAITSLPSGAAQSSPGTPTTVTVSPSISGCTVGTPLLVGTDTFGQFDDPAEVVLITAASGSTITAYFNKAHSGSTTAVPAKVITLSSFSANIGQGRVLVDDSVTYTTGTASAASVGGTTVNGVGTSWTANIVGGSSYAAGCISFAADTTGGIKAWYPVIFVNSTQLTMVAAYHGTQTTAGSYTLSPCGIIGLNLMSYSSTSETQTGIAFLSTPFAWTVGHTVEQSISPYTLLNHLGQISWSHSFAGTTGPDYFSYINAGQSKAGAAIRVPISAIDQGGGASFTSVVRVDANTSASPITMSGSVLGNSDTNGTSYFLGLTTVGSVHDHKGFSWSGTGGNGQQWVNTANQMLLAANASQQFWTNSSSDWTYGIVWDYTAPVGGSHKQTVTIDDASGHMALAYPSYIGPVSLPDTATNTVTLGAFTSIPGGSLNLSVKINVCCADNGAWQWDFAFQDQSLTTNQWYPTAPVSWWANGATTFALDVMSDNSGFINLRLRRTGGSATGLTAYPYIDGKMFGFTPVWANCASSCTASGVATPTSYIPTTILTQSNGQVSMPGGKAVFASLGSVPAAGTFVYCTDCTTASPCAGSGSGHMAVSNGSAWTCQ